MLEHLLELRKLRKWSLQETADRLGIAKSTYAGYESGYREPSLQSLIEMADLFETTVDDILGRSNVAVREVQSGDHTLTIDGVPLSDDEIIDFIAFVRAKRTLKQGGTTT